MPYENTSLRAVILAEHDELRLELSAIESDLELVANGDVPAKQALHERFVKFLDAFLRHVDTEEALLRPVLRDIDAWGHERIARMDAEHRQQRALVRQLAELPPATPAEQWVALVRSFLTQLRVDMSMEENDALDPNVLRDDPIAIDMFGG